MKKTTTKKAAPVAKSSSSVKHFRRPMFVQFISSIAIVLAFMAVLLTFNMITATHMQTSVNQDVAELRMEVSALKEQLSQRTGANGTVVARPVDAPAPTNQ